MRLALGSESEVGIPDSIISAPSQSVNSSPVVSICPVVGIGSSGGGCHVRGVVDFVMGGSVCKALSAELACVLPVFDVVLRGIVDVGTGLAGNSLHSADLC